VRPCPNPHCPACPPLAYYPALLSPALLSPALLSLLLCSLLLCSLLLRSLSCSALSCSALSCSALSCQLLYLIELWRERGERNPAVGAAKAQRRYRVVWLVLYAGAAALLSFLVQGLASGSLIRDYQALVDRGLLWDIGIRIKGLFIQHTKTGNPLVDSVAEHSATPPGVYARHLHHTYTAAPVGLALCLVPGFVPRTNAKIFLVGLSVLGHYFANKMIRLMLLLAPAASCLTAIALWFPLDWAFQKVGVAGRRCVLAVCSLCARRVLALCDRRQAGCADRGRCCARSLLAARSSSSCVQDRATASCAG
jgi:hypothetical protein